MKKIKYQEVENRSGESKLMLLGRHCDKCNKYINGFQKIPIAYDAWGRWDFRCPLCNRAYLKLLSGDKKVVS